MINIDTTKIKQSGQDIVKLSQELNALIEILYGKIYNMPVLTGEWVGASAQLFAKQANNVEKKDAIAIKDTLKKFGDELIDSAERYEVEISKNV